jgi:DNA helicase-2/ATP-dependent DNA helicase PcrA
MSGPASAPVLKGQARKAVVHRGSHLQIIAAAGAGKTAVVSQRVVSLLADGVPASGIVAFTFTERAAAELRSRIAERVEERLGRSVLDQLGGLFVGTIHAYCFRLLQEHVPRYETFDVLDENQLNAFIAREATRLGVKQLDPGGGGKLFASIQAFLKGLDVVENELLDADAIPAPFSAVLDAYLEALERYRLLSYGQQIVRAVRELEKPAVRASVHAELRHLIVDEYQDINPAQERLIELLTGPNVELCVVGDDDQAIYQWRGSDVSNIVEFTGRYPGVAQFSIKKNRRSRPGIIEVANTFAESIPDRLAKQMKPSRPAANEGSAVAVWAVEYELDEAGYIAHAILQLNAAGLPYRDMAVLVRSRAAYPKLLEEFSTFDIPVQPGGRTGLFDQPEARTLGRTFVWLAGLEWREGYGWGTSIGDDDLIAEYVAVFGVAGPQKRRLKNALHKWRVAARDDSVVADLVRNYYELLDVLEVRDWDLDDPAQANRLGTLARVSQLLADYETVRRRARVDAENEGEQVGGQDRGPWYYRHLGFHILNYAQGAYEGFDGEADAVFDAVDLTTIHRAKGLEWPVVFVPSLTDGRLPSRYAGRQQDWPIPRDLFNATRYEGGDAEERRLFYVALTRGRDFVSLSRHERVNKNRSRPSPYWDEVVAAIGETDPDTIDLPPIDPVSAAGDEELQLTFSEIAAFLDCGMAYRLRNLLGFQPRLAPELGYGKAVHHVLRMVAEQTQATGSIPTTDELDSLLDQSFFLPAANKVAHRQLKDAARRLVRAYAVRHQDDLYRVWETERPFELHLDGVTVVGRADVILDKEGGVPTALAIVDYKTSTDPSADHSLQIQVYTDAGRREGLDMRGAYVHDLKAGVDPTADPRTPVDISKKAIKAAEQVVLDAADRIRARDYAPSPGPKCRGCEVRSVCGSAAD